MIKFTIIVFVLFSFFIAENRALNASEYIAYVEELSQDEKFLEEYANWSFELFSQPDYIYGGKIRKFPCAITKDTQVPTSVHTLRPSDVKCVGAMGDSLTAGLGAHAITPIGLLFENRGVSWAIGGDHTYTKVLSVPNAIRQYYPELGGFSTKVSIMALNGQNATNNRLNVAKSGDRSRNMPDQADLLIERLKNEELCDWKNDWKVITLFIGGNDLCSFCEDANISMHSPEQYMLNVRNALDKLYKAPMPRTLVNLVLVLDARGVKTLNSGGFICQTLHKRTCPCAAFPTPDQAKILDEYVPRYQQILVDLIDTGRYNDREDFTVVIQPFMAKTQIPLKANHKVDFSYFAPDCFHFSGKGHSRAALSLWNNMLEPVGGKEWAWHMGETLKCPSDQYPYIFTYKNSAAALAEYKQTTAAATTANKPENSTDIPKVSSTGHHKHKHHKSDSKFDKMQYAVYAGLFILILMLLIVGICKRQQIRVLVHGTGRRHLNGFKNPNYADDSDLEIWNRPNAKSSLSVNNDIPKTHGTRLSFE